MADAQQNKGLGRPERFSGKELDWNDWKFALSSWIGMYDGDIFTEIQAVAQAPEALVWTDFTPEAQRRSQRFCHILVLSMPKGRALDVLRPGQLNQGPIMVMRHGAKLSRSMNQYQQIARWDCSLVL